MTDKTAGRILVLCMALAGLFMLASCGAEAPWFAPEEPVLPGNIIVRSEPAGAAIFLNGEDQSSTTPDTLADLNPGSYQVTVELDNFAPDPTAVTIELKSAQTDSAEFTLTSVEPTDPGNIIVRSTPPGAAIYLNGLDQQATTPDTLLGLSPAEYEVTVELDNHVPNPAMVTINLRPAQTDSAFFTLTSTLTAKKVVILEGFSNVSCPPCPELTDNLVAMAAKPEFPPDQVQFIEFAVSWPQLADPFFLANPQENSDRFGMYNVAAAPDLYIDGVRQGDALDAGAMEAVVLAAMDEDPGFEIEVSADFSSATVPVSVVLTAIRSLDLTDHVLYVAIYEKEVVVNPAPGINGQTEFHHVFRDRVDVPPTLGALAPGNPQQFDLTLTSGSAGADAYVAIAFVQHDTSHAILQAGSTATVKKAEPARSTDETAPVRSLERKSR